MYKIAEKKILNSTTVQMDITAPLIAKKAKPGQFIIFRIDDNSERVPLTIAGTDIERGTVRIIFQMVGKSTSVFGQMNEGDGILDFVGPLGEASHLDGYNRVAVVGGGVGCAIAYPQAKYLFDAGARVDIIAGFRSQDIIILDDDMRACSDTFVLMTDDGSAGEKGLVTNGLKSLIEAGAQYDLVIAIGPPIMMKFVCALTKMYNIKTIVSMNPIMIDGTGMCGCCRVTVGGKMKFACIDGPDFDGHEVDFDELMRRNRMYISQERDADCNLLAKADSVGAKG